MKEKISNNIQIKNKRATFDYELLDTFTAGIVAERAAGRPGLPGSDGRGLGGRRPDRHHRRAGR